MGLLLSINPKEINKNAYNLDYIPINEITHTIIGFDQILEAYSSNDFDDLIVTDESSLMEKLGYKIMIVPGTEKNFKKKQ